MLTNINVRLRTENPRTPRKGLGAGDRAVTLDFKGNWSRFDRAIFIFRGNLDRSARRDAKTEWPRGSTRQSLSRVTSSTADILRCMCTCARPLSWNKHPPRVVLWSERRATSIACVWTIEPLWSSRRDCQNAGGSFVRTGFNISDEMFISPPLD